MTTTGETPQQTGDWWDRLYAEADTATKVPPPRAIVSKLRGRLPDWRGEKPEDLTAEEPADEQLVDGEEGQEQAEEEPASGGNPELSKDEETDPSRWFVAQEGYWPKPPTPPKPTLSDGSKRFLYNVGAGVAGWSFGLTQTIGGAIEVTGESTSIGGALVLGGVICLATAAIWDRRTRHWYRLLAWIARIPLASAITALALYAPASQF